MLKVWLVTRDWTKKSEEGTHTQADVPLHTRAKANFCRSQFKRNSWQNNIRNNCLIHHPNLKSRILSPPAISPQKIQTPPSLTGLTTWVERDPKTQSKNNSHQCKCINNNKKKSCIACFQTYQSLCRPYPPKMETKPLKQPVLCVCHKKA